MEKFEGVEPEIKKEINEEGLEKLEKEGKAENVGSYIKMHKEIALPKEEMSPELKEKIKTGLAWWLGGILQFVDKEGNIAQVEIRPGKIASLPEGSFENELTELGFDFGKSKQEPGKKEELERMAIINTSVNEMLSYEEKVNKQLREKKLREFNF